MRCPACGFQKDRVIDSRLSRDGDAIRRRRECLSCKRRFTTYEYVEPPLVVVKKDGRREPFDREKLLRGMRKACEKRPIGIDSLEKIVESVEGELAATGKSEVTSQEVGGLVMENLKKLDGVAYVRFASVYRSFKDSKEFMEELRRLLEKQK
jgi:transcriptional repressor NrdR